MTVSIFHRWKLHLWIYVTARSHLKGLLLLIQPVLTRTQEGILEARKSPIAHVLLGDFYLSLEEYESAVECTRKGLKLATAEAKKTDLSFQR